MADGAHAGMCKAKPNDSPCHLVAIPHIRGPVAAEGRRRFREKRTPNSLVTTATNGSTPRRRRPAGRLRQRMHAVSRSSRFPPRSVLRPPHDGFRRMTQNNLNVVPQSGTTFPENSRRPSLPRGHSSAAAEPNNLPSSCCCIGFLAPMVLSTSGAGG